MEHSVRWGQALSLHPQHGVAIHKPCEPGACLGSSSSGSSHFSRALGGPVKLVLPFLSWFFLNLAGPTGGFPTHSSGQPS